MEEYFMSKQYVFKKVIDRSGISAKTGNPYEFHQLEFVNKDTLDTLLLDYDYKKLANVEQRFSRGEVVTLELDIIPNGYANRVSTALIVGILPVK
jgi:hypothetical protein